MVEPVSAHGTIAASTGPELLSTERLDTLLQGAQAGDEGSFMQLWSALQPPLLRYLRLRAPGSYQDLASETWLQVVEGIRGFTGDAAAFKGWLFTLARNRAIDAARSQQRRPLVLVPFPGELDSLVSPSAEQQALEQLSTDQALAMLSSLPADHAEVLALRVLADLDVATVARITGKTPGSVRVICHRTLRALAAHPTDEAEVS